jgi:hypothetical protein
LIADSKAILVGTATGETDTVTTPGGQVQVQVVSLTDVLKDDSVRPGEHVYVVAPPSSPFKERGTYLLFLRPLQTASNAPLDQFVPVDGTVGIYPAAGQPGEFSATPGTTSSLPTTIDVTALTKMLGDTSQ